MSSDSKKLNSIKNRNVDKKILQALCNFQTLKKNTRIPKKYKNIIRRSKNTTFIYPNTRSFRITSDKHKHIDFISKMNSMYSTSANITNKRFDESISEQSSDIVIYNKKDFFELNSSKIFRISNYKIIRIR